MTRIQDMYIYFTHIYQTLALGGPISNRSRKILPVTTLYLVQCTCYADLENKAAHHSVYQYFIHVQQRCCIAFQTYYQSIHFLFQLLKTQR